MESWKGFAECLSPNDKQEFLKMLEKLHDYSTAINAKAEPFPSEPVIMALLLEQHKLIQFLRNLMSKTNKKSNKDKTSLA